MKTWKLSIILIAGLVLGACTTLQSGPVGNSAVPQPAKAVDLDRYLGRWYELGRYEAGFQKDCEAVTADYSLIAPSRIRVVNSCRQGSVDGKLRDVTGNAKIVQGSNNAKLRVSFFGPFYGDYWVLDHADDYSWSIVGEPSGRYLWLLSRTATPDEAAKRAILERASQLGYDMKLLRWTRQPSG